MNINTLPFFFKSHSDRKNGGYASCFPFHLYFDEKLRMFRHRNSPELAGILSQVYKQGSLVEGSVSSESGRVYISNVINYIHNHFLISADTSILEIGFGSGILLKEFKDEGLKNLTGIEPGSHTLVDGLEGINLIQDYYPSIHFTDKVDLIYSFGILEHIEDPVDFVREQSKQLNKNGKLIFGVPNCEPYLAEGDPSIFIHEHFSYFTKQSIYKLIEESGLIVEDISVAEGAFLVTVKMNGESAVDLTREFSETDFYNKCSAHIDKLQSVLSEFSQRDIAIYAPARACNSLYMVDKTEVRLVDDNSELHNKFLPGLNSPIESFDDLVNNPPKLLLIFSRTFGERLKAKCIQNGGLSDTLILTLNDLDR